jgi:heavy metal sensor kinase
LRAPSIRARLTAWYALALLLVVTPYATAMLALEWRAARRALDHHLQEDLEVAAEMVRSTSSGFEWSAHDERDSGYDAGPQRWVEVFSVDGRLLFSRGDAVDPAIQRALGPPGEVEEYSSERIPSGAHVRVLLRRHTVDGFPVLLRVARSEDGIRREWSRFVMLFLLTMPAAVVVAAVLGYLLARRALEPMTRMAERAKSISADRLSARLPIENPNDEVGALAAVFNATFERLEESFARLARFTADASHELRTPLTALRSVGEVGLRTARTPAAYQDIIGSMLEEADRLTHVVDSLLLLSRGDAGQVTLTRTALDLSEVAAEAVGEIEVLAEEKHVRVDLSGGRAPVTADRQTVRQALINVLDNAIKYSPPQGIVSVRVRPADSMYAVEISDLGPGIPPSERERIFDRFYRLDKARTQQVEGSGLGLSIARWAVDANGGRIDLASREGVGSTFTILLPAGSSTPRRRP